MTRIAKPIKCFYSDIGRETTPAVYVRYFDEMRKQLPEVDKTISRFEQVLTHWKIDHSRVSIKKDGTLKFEDGLFSWGSESLLEEMLAKSTNPEEQLILSSYLDSINKAKASNVYFDENFSLSFKMDWDFSLHPSLFWLSEMLNKAETDEEIYKMVFSFCKLFFTTKEQKSFDLKCKFITGDNTINFLGESFDKVKEKLIEQSQSFSNLINNQLQQAYRQVEQDFVEKNLTSAIDTWITETDFFDQY